MKRSSTLRRLGWAWAATVCVGSASAAWMPDAPESDSWTALPPSPVTALVHAEAACSSATLGEAVQLIYAHDAPEQAWALAQRCTQEARQQGHAVKRLIAVRIQALIAMRFRDLETLQAAGQALIEQRVLPEYVPDGHMCLAFTCLAQGDTQCARTHLTQARAQFTALQIPHALDQLVPLDQALLHMEAADPSP